MEEYDEAKEAIIEIIGGIGIDAPHRANQILNLKGNGWMIAIVGKHRITSMGGCNKAMEYHEILYTPKEKSEE